MKKLTQIKHFIESNKTLFKILALIPLLILLIQSSNLNIPYPTGDGPEYVLTTEAMFNHNSADLRAEDSKSFKEASTLNNEWRDIPRHSFFDLIEKFIKSKDSLKLMDSYYGSFYVNKDHKVYVHHFIFYSMLNVPMRYVMHWTGQEPLLGFEYTNILLILLTSALLLFYDKNSFWNSLAITLIFFFNAVFWYINWIHTEALTACLASASIFLLFQKRSYWAIFLMSLASLQNQPLAILVLMMVAYTIYLNRFSLKSFFMAGVSSMIVLWPSIFYYSHYGITNLVSYGGYLSKDNVTPERFIGFFFDLNQGAILAIPLILPGYTVLLILFVLKSVKERKIERTLFIPIAILIITYIVCMMNNWIYGMGVINRYAVWISAIIAMHFLFLFHKLRIKDIYKTIITSMIIVSQIFTVMFFEKDNIHDWMYKNHTPPAQALLNHFPSWYNPDPNIFILRTRKDYINVMDPDNSPVIYHNKKYEIMKMAIHKDRLHYLKKYGIEDKRIKEIEVSNKFIFDWTYLNANDFTKINPTYSIQKQKIVEDSLIQIQMNYIKTDSNWIQMIRKKAIDLNLPEDSVLKMDAKYTIDIKNNE